MICPRCGYDQHDESAECGRCGIIFSKYRSGPLTDSSPTEDTVIFDEESGFAWQDIFLNPPQDTNPITLAGRAVLLLALSVLFLKYSYAVAVHGMLDYSILHMVNLPFHEFGHILFRPLGEFMMILGGSLSQLIMPLICLGTFLIKTRDTFAAAVALWWFGQNFLDLAPYIGDARARELMLLGGQTGQDNPGMHDWYNILSDLHLLNYDHTFAAIANYCGIIIMLTACIWAGYIVVQLYRYQQSRAKGLPLI